MATAAFEPDLRAAVAALKSQQTIVYPTDTIWGVGCDATDETAVQAVFDLKKRPPHKSCVVLIAEPKDIYQYVAAPPAEILELLESFDRPTTLVCEGALGIASGACAADGSVAIRVAGDPFCKALIKRFGGPILSTSANISGAPSPATFKEIDPGILARAGYVVKYRQDDEQPAQPSRIVRVAQDGSLDVIRP